MSRLTRHSTLGLALACACALPSTALAQGNGGAEPASDPGETGGTVFTPPPPPPKKAKIDANGFAIAPANAPRAVKRMIDYSNMIVGKPYRYGGGHRPYSARRARGARRGSRLDSGYDCSGSVSHALYGGRFLRTPLASGDLMSWGDEGPGQWITVYANGGHAYLVVAGLRLDTSLRDDPRRTGPQWSLKLRRSASYQPRHPTGF